MERKQVKRPVHTYRCCFSNINRVNLVWKRSNFFSRKSLQLSRIVFFGVCLCVFVMLGSGPVVVSSFLTAELIVYFDF